MVNKIVNEYYPDYVTPPGDTLEETLEALGISEAELARQIGRSPQLINEIVQGNAAVTPEIALQFEQVLGIPANFWLRREQHYREFLALSLNKNLLPENQPSGRAT
ncbi:MAG: HigA family addiction module antidote protein [Chloroflexi bacterium]|nr:HigA family addiction module antidote protein [Chloroflexota bacterium]